MGNMKNKLLAAYPDVAAILQELLVEVQAILGEQFIGLYLHGSLAAGDFNPHRSDIDFVVVTTPKLAGDTIANLARLHSQMRETGAHWANHIEGDYIPLAALRRYDPAQACYPHLSTSGHFAVEQHDSGVIIQHHILREKGVVVAGPPIQPYIGPVTPDELRRATLDILHGWWEPKLINPVALADDEYQVYAVLTMCRMLHTFQFGEVVSKPVAAKWAMDKVNGPFDSAQYKRFSSLITQANAWQNGLPFDKLAETVDFIRYVINYTVK
jgi:predicted nucleotidyltransferase